MRNAATVVITMAGESRRFARQGCLVPKYRLLVRGRPMIWWALSGLTMYAKCGCRFVFVARRDDDASELVQEQCSALGISDVALMELSAPTDGQATSAFLASDLAVDTEKPIIIFNIDTHLKPPCLGSPPEDCDGWIPCFPAGPGAWSFARLTDFNRVAEVAEKVPISPWATVGLYYFGSCSMFRSLYVEYSGRISGERYIAPMYNLMIDRDCRVEASFLAKNDVIPLGTPEEVEQFDPDWRELNRHFLGEM
ncbi:dTDP-glucose pyrophosphorylase [Mesorhizobium sp. M0243]|uniref:dTDP-glucose pyrophosphorylase n=1 Tax=Mesorhizobium sp. M0243 TaxID=2956925 RepID=UPI0033396100